jgi:hypothetical protein
MINSHFQVLVEQEEGECLKKTSIQYRCMAAVSLTTVVFARLSLR